MHIGLHFGKRKPRWNQDYRQQWRSAFDSSRESLAYSLTMTVVQAIILSPILYWSTENYDYLISNSLRSSPLRIHFENEKVWIIGLFLIMFSLSFVANTFFVQNLINKLNPKRPNEYLKVSDLDGSVLPGEADDQHRAS
jgi:hypothetical protein